MENKTFDIINAIICSLCTSGEDSTIRSFSESLGLPVETIRRIFILIKKNSYLGIYLSDYNTEDYDDLDSDEDMILAIQSGDLDDLYWDLDLSENHFDSVLLPLTAMENQALAATEFSLNENPPRSYYVKDFQDHIPKATLELQQKLKKAIQESREIRFLYNNRTLNKTERITCSPVWLVTNITNREIYLIDYERKTYPLGRIHAASLETGHEKKLPASEADKLNKYIWSVSYKENEEPTHVKLRIQKATRNIITRVKNDVASRLETAKIYEDGDYYFYEDDILGMQDFMKWTRSFGSSVVLIEPKDYRDQALERARELKRKYDCLKNWDVSSL